MLIWGIGATFLKIPGDPDHPCKFGKILIKSHTKVYIFLMVFSKGFSNPGFPTLVPFS
jgi:hypothetical protein